jgi:hypothetical protein
LSPKSISDSTLSSSSSSNFLLLPNIVTK